MHQRASRCSLALSWYCVSSLLIRAFVLCQVAKFCRFGLDGQGQCWGGRQWSIVQEYLKRGFTEILQFTPCDLLPLLRGRTLFFSGDSQTQVGACADVGTTSKTPGVVVLSWNASVGSVAFPRDWHASSQRKGGFHVTVCLLRRGCGRGHATRQVPCMSVRGRPLHTAWVAECQGLQSLMWRRKKQHGHAVMAACAVLCVPTPFIAAQSLAHA